MIRKAQHMRTERDRLYANLFREVDTDLRWVGEIGEICFDAWLYDQGDVDHEWITDEAAGRPDFVVDGTTVGVKTVKRKVPMQPHYTAQISVPHAQEPVDDFFFASYEYPQQRLWLVGGIGRQQFLQEARYHAAGESVHAGYRVRGGHAIYNIEIRHLRAPETWLKGVRRTRP